MKEPRDKWPEEKFDEPKAAVLEEIKPEHKGGTVWLQINQVDESKNWRLNPLRFSKWYRSETKRLELGLSLVRVRTWVCRFVTNCRKPKEERAVGELAPNELREVEEQIIREAHSKVYPREITALSTGKTLPNESKFLNLTPI